ncbi:Maf family protein [Altererythrobacter sp. MF3-039]|uniref:Maf family protein n=1 Tax=Altererythrobacter sp. MF3-039 TaxID=3252901 RepID=UPI00390C6EAC
MIVLASKSASRRAMLDQVGIEFDCDPADIDERALEAEMDDAGPEEVVQALAAAKAAEVSSRRSDEVVLGSDSLVVVGERRFDKPLDRENAAEHLHFFSGKSMILHSAAALARGGKVEWVGHSEARLDVRALSEDFIQSYLDAEWPAVSGCVGVFRIEARGPQLFERIIGDQFTVLGMPLLQVLAALRERGEILS